VPNPLIIAAGASLGGGALAANAQKKAASQASAAQTAANDAGIAETRRQFDLVQKNLQPFMDSGTQSNTMLSALLGLSGNPAQANAISGIENSAQFGSLVRNGENAILSNASATGGLRGGNTQAALAQFRPDMLSSLIEQQIGRLQSGQAVGANAAAGIGTAAQNSGSSIANLLQQSGAAQAGGALARGTANANMIGGIGGALGNLMGGIQQPAGAKLFGSWGF
jgi:hypothetical protein